MATILHLENVSNAQMVVVHVVRAAFARLAKKATIRMVILALNAFLITVMIARQTLR